MQSNIMIKNTIAICAAKCIYSFGFSVMFVSLALFLHDSLNLSKNQAAQITGTFLALNFGLPLIAGYLGNNFINFKIMFTIGLIIQAIGYFLFSQVSESSYLIVVLCLILSGGLTNKVGIIEFMSYTVEKFPQHRRAVMLYTYASQNIGFIAGGIFSGIFSLTLNLNTLFLILGFAPAAAAFISYKFITYESSAQKKWRHPIPSFLLTLTALILAMFFVFKLSQTAHSYLLWLAISGISATLIYSHFKAKNTEKLQIVTFGFYMLASTFFWAVFLLTPVMLMYFIKDWVILDWHGFHLQPQWFDSLDPILIVAFAPGLAYLLTKLRTKYKIEIPTYILFGLAIASITIATAFLAHTIPTNTITEKLPAWIIFFYIGTLAIGELLITPEGYTLPGKYAPKKLRGLLTGAWMSSLGISSLLASTVANYIYQSNNDIEKITAYRDTFNWLSIISICGAVITVSGGLWLTKKLKAREATGRD